MQNFPPIFHEPSNPIHVKDSALSTFRRSGKRASALRPEEDNTPGSEQVHDAPDTLLPDGETVSVAAAAAGVRGSVDDDLVEDQPAGVSCIRDAMHHKCHVS